ncbi:tyrosine-type recombinase/integrase [Serratia rubidaea]|uniref:tyrosine-type recombinase/integrase n=1 Tax=Serratia rubidaea TaxID=61652 RepID=UPI0020133817|nr:tyrosine-type recombinase/integrase [Serratia rubidaea]
MANKLSHTIQRGRTFYTNFRLNDSNKFVRLSLNTDSLKQARIIMARLAPYIPLVQAGSMTVEAFKLRVKGLRDLTRHDLDTFLLRHLEGDISEAESIPQIAKAMGDIPTVSQEEEISAIESEIESRQKRLFDGDIFSEQLIKESLQAQGFDVSAMENEISLAGTDYDMRQLLLKQAYKAFYTGDIVGYRGLLTEIKKPLQQGSSKLKSDIPKPPKLSAADSNDDSDFPTITEAWNLYRKEKGLKWRAPVERENQKAIDLLLHIVGDVPVNQVTKQNIRDALQIVENLPRRTIAPYINMTLEECIAADIPEEDLISSENAKKYLKIWRSLFKVYLVDKKDILEKSPTDGITFTVKQNRGGSYSQKEIERIKSLLLAFPDGDWRRDYFLTLIYTGARRGEIANIRKEHIRKDDETGRYYIFVEGGKTEHAQRQIPISKHIEGILRLRADKTPAGAAIFGDLPTHETILKMWLEIMRQADSPSYDEFGLKRRIHSLRHTFISTAIAATGNTTLVQFVVGHSRTQSLGITARYTHRPPLKELLCVVDCLP